MSIMANIGRNEACPCGSGKKHKNCVTQTDDVATGRTEVLANIHIDGDPVN
jgi:hypothetical protein